MLLVALSVAAGVAIFRGAITEGERPCTAGTGERMGCAPRARTGTVGTAQATAETVSRRRPGRGPAADGKSDLAACRQRIDRVLGAAPLPGASNLATARPEVLLYAKAEPVYFVRPPVPDSNPSRAARTYRRLLGRAHSAWTTINRLWPVFSAKPELGRSVLLRGGYLYAETPALAFALVDQVSAQMLFSDQEIWIQRGERVLPARRTLRGDYVFTAGQERGQRVRLMLFDRIGTGERPPVALHRDFRSLRQRLGFDRARVVHATDQA